MVLRRFLLVFLVCLSIKGRGQSSVGMDTSYYVIPDTLVFDTSSSYWPISVVILNTGPNPVFDSITLYAAVDTLNTDSIYTIFYSGTQIEALGIQDSAQRNFTSPVLPTAFKAGINTVVIWPKASSPTITTSDSLFVTIFIDTSGWSGYFLPKKGKGFMLFPNPAGEVLIIKPFHTEHPYRKLEVYDLEGRLIIRSDFTKNLDISFLEKGAYILSIEQYGADPVRVRFLKE
jgi:hypothetical protein